MPHISRALTTAEQHLKAASEHLTCPTASVKTLQDARKQIAAAIIQLQEADGHLSHQINAQLGENMAGRRFSVVR